MILFPQELLYEMFVRWESEPDQGGFNYSYTMITVEGTN